MLQRTQAAIGRLSGLIDELLTAARFEAGMAMAEITDVEVAPILEAIRAEAVDPDRVRVTCPPDLRERADAKLLKQALPLTVDNAMKYGGNAEITAGPAALSVRARGRGVP